jgi:hypothetical protein
MSPKPTPEQKELQTKEQSTKQQLEATLFKSIESSISLNSFWLPIFIALGFTVVLLVSFCASEVTVTTACLNQTSENKEKTCKIDIHPSVIGFLLMTTSLTFYYLYLVYIYPKQIEALESIINPLNPDELIMELKSTNEELSEIKSTLNDCLQKKSHKDDPKKVEDNVATDVAKSD